MLGCCGCWAAVNAVLLLVIWFAVVVADALCCRCCCYAPVATDGVDAAGSAQPTTV